MPLTEDAARTFEFLKRRKVNYQLAANQPAMQEMLIDLAKFCRAGETSVVKDKNGIGYGGAAYGGSSKLLSIKKTDVSPAILPTEENVISGTYPIWRHLYIYVNPALDKGEVAAYLNWIRSDDGQKYVKDIGYYPLPKNLRSN